MPDPQTHQDGKSPLEESIQAYKGCWDVDDTLGISTTAEFPFDFATLLNSAEWLAPGMEWINTTPATIPVPLVGPDLGGLQTPISGPGPDPMVMPSTASLSNVNAMGTDDGLPMTNVGTDVSPANRLWF